MPNRFGTHAKLKIAQNSPPDASGLPPHLVLAAEGAGVLGVLRDLHLLHSLPQGGAVPGIQIDFSRFCQAVELLTWCHTFQ